MKKFEYLVEEKDTDKCDRNSPEEHSYITNMGNIGYELVSVVPKALGMYTLYYWKREKENEKKQLK